MSDDYNEMYTVESIRNAILKDDEATPETCVLRTADLVGLIARKLIEAKIMTREELDIMLIELR